MHAEGGAAAGVGVPNPLGEQAHRCARSRGAFSGAHESAERARLADMARLSVAHPAVAALSARDELLLNRRAEDCLPYRLVLLSFSVPFQAARQEAAADQPS